MRFVHSIRLKRNGCSKLGHFVRTSLEPCPMHDNRRIFEHNGIWSLQSQTTDTDDFNSQAPFVYINQFFAVFQISLWLPRCFGRCIIWTQPFYFVLQLYTKKNTKNEYSFKWIWKILCRKNITPICTICATCTTLTITLLQIYFSFSYHAIKCVPFANNLFNLKLFVDFWIGHDVERWWNISDEID